MGGKTAGSRLLLLGGLVGGLGGSLGGGAGVAGVAAAQEAGTATPADPGRLEERIDALRDAWAIPGLAVTVVAGDSVLMARGFGVRRAGGPEPVDDGTLFAIGSTTKAFTSALVATLVEEGRLGWDDRVVDRLPWFRLHDPWVTREITLRDLLAHRSGLPMANFMWLPGGVGPEELVRRLEHLDPAVGLRAGFTYQNVLYAAVGEVVEEVTGRSWAQAVSERLLEPLGMRRSRTGVEGVDALDNVARPHVLLDAGATPVPFRDIAAVGPAGSILSSAGDMAPWLLYQLRSGGAGGVPEAPAALAETHIPQTPMRMEGPLAVLYPRASMLAYGMGWTVSDYGGRTLLDHSGGIDGMTSVVALLPDEGIGVSILANRQLPLPPYWVLYTILDAVLGEQEVTDWSAPFEELAAAFAAMPEAERVPDAPPSREIGAFTGEYESPVLGMLRVSEGAEGLTFALGGGESAMGGTLEPWHYDTFRGVWRDVAWSAAAGPAWLTFRAGSDGTVASVVLEPLPGEAWEFARRRQPSSSSAQSRR